MSIDVQMPNTTRNYCVFNQSKVNFYVNQRENALPHLENVLKTTKDENFKFTIQDVTCRHYHDDSYGFSCQEP